MNIIMSTWYTIDEKETKELSSITFYAGNQEFEGLFTDSYSSIIEEILNDLGYTYNDFADDSFFLPIITNNTTEVATRYSSKSAIVYSTIQCIGNSKNVCEHLQLWLSQFDYFSICFY